MTHEEICTYEVCKLAKEKGFPQDGHHKYYEFGGSRLFTPTYKGAWYRNSPIPNTCVAAPTQSLLQRWLREEKKIDIAIVPLFSGVYSYIVYNIHCRDNRVVNTNAGYATYELALEDALKYALENLI